MPPSRSDTIQEATKRLDAAVETLENLLEPHIAEAQEGETLGSLRERVRLLTEERDQLRAELDAVRHRSRRLESANDEVSERLEALMSSLAADLSAASG